MSLPMARVIINPGDKDEYTVELQVGTTTIGRGRDVDIRVANKSLSRRHATLEYTLEGNASLRDNSSKNGTYLRGERLEAQAKLRDCDRFSCGDVAFSYSCTEYSVPPPETMVQEISAEATRVLVNELLSDTNRRGPAIGRARQIRPKTAQGRLQVLLEVARLLSSPESIAKQLAKILDLVFSIIDVDRAAIIMIDEHTGEFGAPVVESGRGVSSSHGEGYSSHILNYVRERSVAALFSDAASDPRLEDAHSVHFNSVRSSMCAPLKPKDEVIGVLYVDNLTIPAIFNGEDLELLSAFAAQAAIALENARLHDQLKREAVSRSNLLRFFPPTTIAQLMERPDLTVEAIETEVTALFCDISGFTAMSATMQPTEVVALLNHYFPRMTEVVFRHEGTLEKYIGDAMLAVWGAPFRHDDDAQRAVLAAVEMQRAIQEMASTSGFPDLSIHIGLNSGPVAAGNIGSEHYLQYATIGDATNLASRICNVAKAGEIAIGDPTLRLLGDDHPWTIEGPFEYQVKGRERPLPVYKVIY